jgi:DNA-binding HxlR family transcriptional regulator
MLNLKKAIRNETTRGILIYLTETQATPKDLSQMVTYTKKWLYWILRELIRLGVLERTPRWDSGSKFTFYKTTYKGKLLLEAHGYAFVPMKRELKEFLREIENG